MSWPLPPLELAFYPLFANPVKFLIDLKVSKILGHSFLDNEKLIFLSLQGGWKSVEKGLAFSSTKEPIFSIDLSTKLI